MARPSRKGGKKSAAKTRKARSTKGSKPASRRDETRPRGGSEQSAKRRHANKPKDRKTTSASIADFQKRVAVLTRELKETRDQRSATTEVLRIINSQPGSLAPVFDAILQKAHALCGADDGSLQIYDGEHVRAVAVHGVTERFAKVLREGLSAFKSPAARASFEGQRYIQINDARKTSHTILRAAAELTGTRTILYMPLRMEDHLLGFIAAARREVKPFTENEIGLLENFAAQAVIAMENARLFNETKEALERQTATADILKVIASSPDDVQPVFQAIADRSNRLIDALSTTVFTLVDGIMHLRAFTPTTPQADAMLRARFPAPLSTFSWGASIGKGDIYSVVDAEQEPELRDLARERGWRSCLCVPLLRDGKPIGMIGPTRAEPGPFTEHHVQLMQTFADQAAIAIENTRLFNETREALEHQTATAEVLKVISSSMADPQPVFARIVDSIERLFQCKQIGIFITPGDGLLHLAAGRGVNMEAVEAVYPLPVEQTAAPFVLGARQQVYYADCLNGLDVPQSLRRAAKVIGNFSDLLTPMMWEGRGVGMMTITREPNAAFSEKEQTLLRTFADQAVIAIENARLFNEVQAKTRDLEESLQQQTATADVLKVISRSSVDLGTVLDTLVETAASLCRAEQAAMYRRQEDDKHYLVAAWGMSEAARQFALAHPRSPGRGSLTGRVLLEHRAVHVPDVLRDSEYTYSEGQKAMGYRSLLGIPLLREDALLGVFTINRTRLEAFTDKEIELATTFADQAVIAIENARLFEELRERQAELRVTFDNMGDGVVMFGADTRLVAWNRNFQEILDLPDAFLAERPSYADYFRYLAERGEYSADLQAELSRTIGDTSQERRFERTRPDGRVIEVRRNPVPSGGFVLIYADITERKRAEQAIRAARDAAEMALRELQAAQASLVHAQKMAALGQVTAGIAHEIKNPLNFVNNFASLSVELLDELKDAAAKAAGALDPGNRDEIVETIGMLTENLQKIVEHGRRADGIVRSMLQHSRGSSDDRQPTDLNALAEEALNLAYHGARAQDPNFDIALEHDLDRNLAPVDVVPQELTRVLLNLIGNGFYAANKRSRESNGTYRPAVKVTTREFGESVEVRVRDNGVGVPPEDRDKLFQPFFTTKPTGEGTGLGLSISYEVVTQQHGGTITVDSEVGDFTEFTVRLPRRGHMLTG